MFSWANIISGLVALWNKFAEYRKNKQLMDAGAAISENEARDEADKITVDIKRKQSDDSVLSAKRKKYTRKDS